MDMKSQFYFAYLAGLDPLQLLMRYGPDSYRKSLPAPAGDQPPTDLPRAPSRRRRALLLLAVSVGLAIGAWQLLSTAGETKAAKLSAQGTASGTGHLILALILVLVIGAGEVLTRIDAGRPAAASVQAAATAKHLVRA
jgi:hypothetical protein